MWFRCGGGPLNNMPIKISFSKQTLPILIEFFLLLFLYRLSVVFAIAVQTRRNMRHRIDRSVLLQVSTSYLVPTSAGPLSHTRQRWSTPYRQDKQKSLISIRKHFSPHHGDGEMSRTRANLLSLSRRQELRARLDFATRRIDSY